MTKLPKRERRIIDLEDIGVPENLSLTEPNILYPPGHAVFLAIFFKLTGQARYVYPETIVLLLDAVVAPLLLYFLGKRLFSRGVGLVAASLYSVWLSFAFLATQARSEQLLSSVSLGLLVSLYMFLTQWRWRWLAVMAILIAVGVNLRPDMLATVPLAAAAVAIAKRKRWIQSIAYAALVGCLLTLVAVASLIPYAGLYWEAFGRLGFATPALAVNVWEGIGEYPNRWGATSNDDDVRALLQPYGLRIWTPEAEKQLWSKIRPVASEDPVWLAGTFARRAVRILFMKYDWGAPSFRNKLDIPGAKVSAHCASWKVLPGGSATCWLVALGYIAMVRGTPFLDWSLWIGAIVGVIIFRKRPYVWLLLVLPLARLIPFSFIHVEPRYILYGMGPSLVFLAALLVTGWQSRTRVLAAAQSVWPQRKPAV
ncbi:MAG: glycosyltransferase family 39 protein [Dehalococcoidia bacterium]|nr:glycosyltransferase family 39 protein [Dehalococcoidia bacterium]